MKSRITQGLVGLAVVSFGAITVGQDWPQWVVDDPVTRGSGQEITRLNAVGGIDPNTFVSGLMTADTQGNISYTVVKLTITNDPLTNDPWSFGPPTLAVIP